VGEGTRVDELPRIPPRADHAASEPLSISPLQEVPLHSLSLVYDLALRSYDYADRRYDLIGTRASALIGFSSLLVTGAAVVVHRLSPYLGLWLFTASIFLGLTTFLLYHGLLALFARQVHGLPAPEVIYARYVAHDERSFRIKMISTFGEAREKYTQACDWKAQHLRWGMKAFVVILFLLVPALMLIPDPPANKGVTNGELERK
jgi:hypothetical protein